MLSKNKLEIMVDGMKCSHCEKRIKEALLENNNITKVNTNIEKKKVIIYYREKPSIDEIKKIIEELDYKVIE